MPGFFDKNLRAGLIQIGLKTVADCGINLILGNGYSRVSSVIGFLGSGLYTTYAHSNEEAMQTLLGNTLAFYMQLRIGQEFGSLISNPYLAFGFTALSSASFLYASLKLLTMGDQLLGVEQGNADNILDQILGIGNFNNAAPAQARR